MLPVVTAGVLVCGLVLAPAASAAGARAPIAPLAFLGLPSLHSIIEAIAKGFFGALAGALVPGFLKHGTVAMIQGLVALPDPASWGHVSELESDMTYLGMSLMPVTLTVCTLRYWTMGLTGAAHPAGAIGRCAGATGVLVIYRWLVEQTVAATNTLTHAILGWPVVANGLASIITVLFGGALLLGAGGVFGAFLVIVGVIFAAGLFASKEALTVVLALAFCAGPLFIALAPIPELSHLARAWGHALMAIVLVPLGWTLLFAVTGALTLDATSFTGGASGGIPGHIEAAFAGLITFVIAVKLPLMLLGELRQILGGAGLRGGGGSGGAQGQSTMPGAERMRAAHARLRSAAFEGVPSLGRSTGRAAGAMGAPAGGPVGAARRGLAGAARRTGLASSAAAGAAAGGGALAGAVAAGRGSARRGRGGVRERLSSARATLASAPRDARAAMSSGSRKPGRVPVGGAAAQVAARGAKSTSPSNATGKTRASIATGKASKGPTGTRPPSQGARPSPGPSSSRPAPRAQPRPRSGPAPSGKAPAPKAAPAASDGAHPGRKVTTNAHRDAAAPAKPTQPSRPQGQRSKSGGAPPAAPRPKEPARRAPVKRNPRPRSKS
jgi:hypothetical protein